jgi:hypothetical protein
MPDSDLSAVMALASGVSGQLEPQVIVQNASALGSLDRSTRSVRTSGVRGGSSPAGRLWVLAPERCRHPRSYFIATFDTDTPVDGRTSTILDPSRKLMAHFYTVDRLGTLRSGHMLNATIQRVIAALA